MSLNISVEPKHYHFAHSGYMPTEKILIVILSEFVHFDIMDIPHILHIVSCILWTGQSVRKHYCYLGNFSENFSIII